jgi:uncharacterized protein
VRFLSLPISLLLLWVQKHPVASLFLSAVLLAGFIPGLSRLSVDTTSEALLVPGDPGVAHYAKTRETFGEDVILTVVIRQKDVFTPEVLRAVENLTVDGSAIDGVANVVSLTTVNNLRGREGTLDTSPLIPSIPTDPKELARLRHDALSNPILLGEVINPEGNTTAIHFFIESREKDHGFARQLVDRVESLIEREKARLGPEAVIYQVGSPYVKTEIIRSIHEDGSNLFPYATLALILALYFFYGSTLAFAIPILTGALSIVGTLGFMGWMDYQINPITTILPSLLLVIGSTEDIHMISEYADEISLHGRKAMALKRMAVRMGAAISMTTITTFLGFLSLSGHSIPILREFGIAASFGIAFNFLITLLVVPPCLHFWPIPKKFRQTPAEQFILHHIRTFILHANFRHTGWVIAVIALLTGAAAWSCQHLVINTSYGEFFREESPLRLRYKDLTEHLTPGTNVLITLESDKPGEMLRPEVLRQADLLREHLQARKGKVLGYTDFLRKLHLEMNNGDPAFNTLPQSADLIAQYALMLSPQDLSRFLSFDQSSACFLLRTELNGSRNVNAAADEIEEFARRNLDPSLKVRVTGEVVLVARSSDTMSREVLNNLITLGITIFVVIAVFFRSALIAGLVMIPNIVPIVLNFGLMVLAGIPLSTATFPVSVIALGMTVDDTIHMMARYTRERKRRAKMAAIHTTLAHEIRPVLTTTLAHTCGFSVLMFGEFESVRQFGMLAAWAMISAILADLFLTPALLALAPSVRNK